MSLRQRVDQARIAEFLKRLGEQFRHPARLYLVGGSTLVYEGLRQQTIDVDVVLEADAKVHGEFVKAIRDLKDRLSINVEEASPGDFIPLPGGYANRHEYIGRFGQLDVWHFDLYSLALAKIERGRAQDMEDVLTLLRVGRIEWERLHQYFKEILPRMGEHSLRQDPVEFEQNFREVERQWRSKPDVSGETA